MKRHVEKYYHKKTRSDSSSKTIDVTKVSEFGEITEKNNRIVFGAAITWEEMREKFQSFPNSIFEQAAKFMAKGGSLAVRNQATWAGSISLQKMVPKFASDMSVMLASMGMVLDVIDCSSQQQVRILILLIY